MDQRLLKLLSRDFPNIPRVTTEIINLEAILNLPKPTEHFLADLHGANEAFQHVLRNASGNIKRKVGELFAGTMREQEKKELCTLIYYPEQKLELIKQSDADIKDFYVTTLNQLITVCRRVSSKYTRSKVRKSLPEEFAYIIEELLHESNDDLNKQAYFNVIIDTIIETSRADAFIIALCHLIQRLSIDQLHILGDIFDRGSGAAQIMDTLCDYHNLDIQWGNHDVLWMGAAAGNAACICSVLRIALRYANFQTPEDDYAINMLPLATFAMETYDADEALRVFKPKFDCSESSLPEKQIRLLAQMHKAISVIQFKLESKLYRKHPEWQMDDRLLLSAIDFEHGTVRIDGKDYPLLDTSFPTIDPAHPEALTAEEQEIVTRLTRSFKGSERLHRHIRLLLGRGSIYNIYNSNLLYHASVPMNVDGTLKTVHIDDAINGKGKALLDQIETRIRLAFASHHSNQKREHAIDFFWYLWCGPDSPLFDKAKMATFERYFIADKATHEEPSGLYYHLRDNEKTADTIMDDFGVKGRQRHIINGHVPVRVGDGESPIKAGGKLMVIDGGFAGAYHKKTGIAGYTLVYHSRGFQLVQHDPFMGTAEAVRTGRDIVSTTQIVEMTGKRLSVKDSDKGKELGRQIDDLKELLAAYQSGALKES